jgi:hypothetical protein
MRQADREPAALLLIIFLRIGLNKKKQPLLIAFLSGGQDSLPECVKQTGNMLPYF